MLLRLSFREAQPSLKPPKWDLESPSFLPSTNTNLQYSSGELLADRFHTHASKQDTPNQLTSLASVGKKKIPLLSDAEKGDTYLFIIEEYCCYVNLSGQMEERTKNVHNCFGNHTFQGVTPSLDSLSTVLAGSMSPSPPLHTVLYPHSNDCSLSLHVPSGVN